MAVQEQTGFDESTATGLTGVFPYSFKILRLEDMRVEIDGVVVDGLGDYTYTVSGIGEDAGGNVTITPNPTAGAIVLRALDPKLDRQTNYQYAGDLKSPVVNADFDRLWLAMQAIKRRSLLFPIQDGADHKISLPPDLRAGKYLGFDEAGNIVIRGGLSPDVGRNLVYFAATYNTIEPKVTTLAATLANGATIICESDESFTPAGIKVRYTVASGLATDPVAEDASGVRFKSAGTGAVVQTVQDKAREAVSVEDFGAIGDGTLHAVAEWIIPGALGRYVNLAALQVDYPHVTATTDSIDWAAIVAGRNAAIASGAKLKLKRKTYKYNLPLTFSGIDVDFGGAYLFYAGPVGSFALTLNSSAGSGIDQTSGNAFENFTLYQSDFTEFVTFSGSTTYDPPSIAGGSAISNITPGGVSTTVSVPGATVGGFARATFTNTASGIELTARVTAPDVVTVTFSNYSAAAIDLAPGTLSVTVVNNAYHGLCMGGSLGRLRSAKVRGFTGVSFGFGNGVDVTSGVTFSGAERAYYWRGEVNIAGAAGWGMIIPPRNNENEIALSTFPINAYSESAPRRANAINQLVIGGLTNTITKLSLEASASEETIVLLPSANLNSCPANAYIEYNTSWVVPAYPRVLAKAGSSANTLRIRHAYGGKAISDLGTANNISVPPAFSVNGSQELPVSSSRSLIVNGDFNNATTSWSNFSTGSTLSVTGSGVFTGKRARLDLVAGRPNLQQDIHTVSGVNLSGLIGQNITVGVWLKTNIAGVKPRLGGVTGGVATADETDQFITVTYKVPVGATTLPLSIITDASGLTGYVEISNVTGVIGNNAFGLAEPTEPVGSATYNPPSIAAAAQATTTVSVPGAALGDYVIVSFSLDLQGIELSAYVSATDTVTCIFKNGTAAPVDLASGTLRARVIKA